jgi:hypothetical protein
MARSQAGKHAIVLFQKGIRETACWGAQQKKKFAGPQKNVQQTAALQIVDIFTVQGHVQRPPRTLLNEGPQRGEIERHASGLLAPGIDTLQIFVAEFYEMVQAKILLSQ